MKITYHAERTRVVDNNDKPVLDCVVADDADGEATAKSVAAALTIAELLQPYNVEHLPKLLDAARAVCEDPFPAATGTLQTLGHVWSAFSTNDFGNNDTDPKEQYVCERCGSDRISLPIWHYPNTDELGEWYGQSDLAVHCDECEKDSEHMPTLSEWKEEHPGKQPR